MLSVEHSSQLSNLVSRGSCFCLKADKTKWCDAGNPNCSLNPNFNQDSLSKCEDIRKCQFLELRSQWKYQVDLRSEKLLDCLICEMLLHKLHFPSRFFDLYEPFNGMIGSGSNGRIFQTKRKTDGLQVAVKVVLNMKKGSLNEIKMLTICQKSEFVVQFIDAFGLEADSILTLVVMKLEGHPWTLTTINQSKITSRPRINNRDLKAFMLTNPVIPEQIFIYIIRQLLKLITFLHHEKLLIHGDLKPANILIDGRYKITLIDLCTCQSIKESPMIRKYKGSTYYASPYVFCNAPFDGRLSDNWSLGMTIYALRYGFNSRPSFIKNVNDFTEVKFPMPPICFSDQTEKMFNRLMLTLFNQNPDENQIAQLKQEAKLWTHQSWISKIIQKWIHS